MGGPVKRRVRVAFYGSRGGVGVSTAALKVAQWLAAAGTRVILIDATGRGDLHLLLDLEPDSIGSLAGDPQAMARYVTDNARPGSIILLHPWSKGGGASRRALPLILAALAARGYGFVTVSELLAPR